MLSPKERAETKALVIKQLAYLVALAREKHFARAAKACNISQPTLSGAIRALEEELGVPLVERGYRFAGLTAEGEMILEHAKRILAEIDTMQHSISDVRQGLSGRLRIGAIPTALPLVAAITGPFSERFPAVTLTVLSMTSTSIQSAIDSFEIDVGITYLDNEPLEHVISKPLYSETYVLLTRLDSALARRHAIGWREAADLNLCLLTPDMQNRRILDGIFRSVGKAPVPVMETNSIFNLCTHANVPGWVSIVPSQLPRFFGIPAGLKALRLVEPVTSRSVGLILADRQPQAPLARSLLALSEPIPAEE
jgi:DNA-binding transcriptional LysR family regulator